MLSSLPLPHSSLLAPLPPRPPPTERATSTTTPPFPFPARSLALPPSVACVRASRQVPRKKKSFASQPYEARALRHSRSGADVHTYVRHLHSINTSPTSLPPVPCRRLPPPGRRPVRSCVCVRAQAPHRITIARRPAHPGTWLIGGTHSVSQSSLGYVLAALPPSSSSSTHRSSTSSRSRSRIQTAYPSAPR